MREPSDGSDIHVRSCSDVPHLTADDLAPIFWANTTWPFRSSARSAGARTHAEADVGRAQFRAFWLDRYVSAMPQAAFLAVSTSADATSPAYVGYVVGAHDDGQIPTMVPDPRRRLIADPAEFAGFSATYPAHLHINVIPNVQGSGVGRRLIEAFCERAAACGAVGVRVVTGAAARNIGFYKALGFKPLADADDAIRRRLALLGRALSTAHV